MNIISTIEIEIVIEFELPSAIVYRLR